MGVEGIKRDQQRHSPDLEYQDGCNATVNDLADECHRKEQHYSEGKRRYGEQGCLSRGESEISER